jgi:hypothetical protein
VVTSGVAVISGVTVIVISGVWVITGVAAASGVAAGVPVSTGVDVGLTRTMSHGWSTMAMIVTSITTVVLVAKKIAIMIAVILPVSIGTSSIGLDERLHLYIQTTSRSTTLFVQTRDHGPVCRCKKGAY